MAAKQKKEILRFLRLVNIYITKRPHGSKFCFRNTPFQQCIKYSNGVLL